VFTNYLHFLHNQIKGNVYTNPNGECFWAGGIQGVLPAPTLAAILLSSAKFTPEPRFLTTTGFDMDIANLALGARQWLSAMYIAMEAAPGKLLRQVLSDRRKLPAARDSGAIRISNRPQGVAGVVPPSPKERQRRRQRCQTVTRLWSLPRELLCRPHAILPARRRQARSATVYREQLLFRGAAGIP
jgi:hypothetical protein